MDPAAERTQAALFAALGAFGGIDGIERIDEGDLVRTIAPGRPYAFLNAAFDLRIADDRLADRVGMLVARYRAVGLPLNWWVTELSSPGLLERLVALGLEVVEEEPGMAIGLDPWPGTLAGASSSDVRVEVVHDRETLAGWVSVIAGAYAWEDEAKAATLRTLYDPGRTAGPGTQLLAHLDGLPAGAASLFEVGGLAWVTNVGTLPAARGRGVGAAVTVACLRLAAERGHGAAYLAASPMGRPVYERLGFRHTCGFTLLSSTGAALTTAPAG